MSLLFLRLWEHFRNGRSWILNLVGNFLSFFFFFYVRKQFLALPTIRDRSILPKHNGCFVNLVKPGPLIHKLIKKRTSEAFSRQSHVARIGYNQGTLSVAKWTSSHVASTTSTFLKLSGFHVFHHPHYTLVVFLLCCSHNVIKCDLPVKVQTHWICWWVEEKWTDPVFFLFCFFVRDGVVMQCLVVTAWRVNGRHIWIWIIVTRPLLYARMPQACGTSNWGRWASDLRHHN